MWGKRPKLCRPCLKCGALGRSRGSTEKPACDDEDEGASIKGVKSLGSGGSMGETRVGVGETRVGVEATRVGAEGSRVRDSHSLVTDCRSDLLGGE